MKLFACVLLFAFACGGANAERTPMPDPLEGVEARQLFEHGAGLAQRGDAVRAEQYIVAAIERGYPREEALPILLRVCIASDRLSSALTHAEPYLREHPDQWALRYLVATIYLGLDRADDAARELQRVIDDAPDQAVPHFTLGILEHERRGNHMTARALLERYLELDPRGRHAAEARSVLSARPVSRVEGLGDLAGPPAGEVQIPTEAPELHAGSDDASPGGPR
ncbi:MAG: tetratricopeptide repeat protein [Myxococcales bacterium]|nr:tetratricopeptide repeat protein [Myxococcales bacterium]